MSAFTANQKSFQSHGQPESISQTLCYYTKRPCGTCCIRLRGLRKQAYQKGQKLTTAANMGEQYSRSGSFAVPATQPIRHPKAVAAPQATYCASESPKWGSQATAPCASKKQEWDLQATAPCAPYTPVIKTLALVKPLPLIHQNIYLWIFQYTPNLTANPKSNQHPVHK